jgi:hypothetical protein
MVSQRQPQNEITRLRCGRKGSVLVGFPLTRDPQSRTRNFQKGLGTLVFFLCAAVLGISRLSRPPLAPFGPLGRWAPASQEGSGRGTSPLWLDEILASIFKLFNRCAHSAGPDWMFAGMEGAWFPKEGKTRKERKSY